VNRNTIAKSIAIGQSADGPYALDIARRKQRLDPPRSSDEQIWPLQLLAEKPKGCSPKPAAAPNNRRWLKKLVSRARIDPSENHRRLTITGNALKDP